MNNNDVDDTNYYNRIKSLNPKVYKDLKKIEQEGREKELTEKEIAHRCIRFLMHQMRLNIREFSDIYPRLSREVDANPTDKFPELLRLMRTINPAIEEFSILLKKYNIKEGITTEDDDKEEGAF